MTNEELSDEIRKSIEGFSATLRPLVEEAARRLTADAMDHSLNISYRYGSQVMADIENKRLKK